jgi:DNA-binding response OmpR family regulator/ligand-binding sensor domain-containing protein/signal transduction histidine kinase
MKLFTTILLFIYACGMCFAQRSFQSSEYQLLNMNNGLCNNSITDIELDPAGILWISTDAGISRYDGVSFYSRTLADKEPVALASLMTSSGNLVWSMAKYRARICCFNRMTGQFMTVDFDGEDILSRILNIRLAGDRLMAVTPDALYELHYAVEDDDHVRLTPKKILSQKEPFVNIYGHGDIVYMSTANRRLVIYDTATGKTRSINEASLLIQDPTHIRHSFLGDDHLWLCSDREGLICYSLKENRVRHIAITEPEDGLSEASIRDIARVNDTVYIVSTRSSILKMTFESPRLTQAAYRTDDLTPNREVYGGLLNERINCITFDKANRILWVGTQGSGLMKLRLWADDILLIPLQRELGHYNQIAQGAKGYLWMATDQGFFRSDAPELTAAIHFTRWPNAPRKGRHCLYRDSEANLWVGNEAGEVTCLNTHTGEELTYTPQQPVTTTSVGPIRRICLSSHNLLWIVSEKGLAVFDPKSRQTLAYRSFIDFGFEVNCLTEDSDGAMWLGTNRGLYLCTRRDNTLMTQTGYEAQMGMNPGLVRSLYINRYNQLLAAYTNKVITVDDKSKELTSSLLVNRELTDGHIQCMVDDRNGNTWMGGNTGISTYNNRSGRVFHYDSSCNYFDGAYLADGRLVWATSTGLIAFSPEQMREEAIRKRLSLSAVEVNNVRLNVGMELNGQVILDRPTYLVEELTLCHNNNNVVLAFTSLTYSASREPVYYRLQGTEEWTTAWDGLVRLNALAPGRYTLEVRPPMPFEGEVESLVIPIRVKRHPALTGWAFLGYILALAAAGYGLAYYLQRRMERHRQHISEREDLEEALDEEIEKREEVERQHKVREDYQLSLAQEMRDPLAMAVGPLKELAQDATLDAAARHKAGIAYRNTIYLQDICNQVLNICQQEGGVGTLSVAAYAVSDLADDAVRAVRDLLGAGDLQLEYDKTVRIREEVWVDRRKIAFVLGNLLSSAFRHVNYSGRVELHVELLEHVGRECCLYRVSDHRPLDVSAKQPDEVGLEVMNDIAESHGGDISITHAPDGTEASLYLPLGNAHFAGQPNVSFVEPEIIEPDEENETLQIEEEERDALQQTELPHDLFRPVNPGTRFTVLVIEDNSDIRLYLKVLLNAKYNVLLAENGQEGIRIARKEEPDLILTDVMMPVMDGLECCRLLKEDLKTCHIPVIMLTALTSDADVVKGLECGADDYILKPFNPEILRSKIKSLIQNRVELKRIYTRLLTTAHPVPEAEAPEAEAGEGSIRDPFIAAVLDQVKRNLQNPDFSVKRLAEHMNMSQPTLYRRVKQLTNYTIIELIRGVRLKEAAELLKSRKYSVQEVSEMVGYNDVPTFRKHFSDLYGTTPSAFVQKEN